MLRITRRCGDGTVTLHLEGRISSGWLSVLEQECLRSLQTGSAVDLDFRGVTALDDAGLALIRRLEERGARVTRCTELMRDLLGPGTTGS